MRGVFVAAQLPPGQYNVAVEKSGFRRLTKNDIILNATDLANAGDFTLDLMGPPDIAALTYGQGALTGTLTDAAHYSLYSFEGQQGDIVSILALGWPRAASSTPGSLAAALAGSKPLTTGLKAATLCPAERQCRTRAALRKVLPTSA